MSTLSRIADFLSLAPMQPVETRGAYDFEVYPSMEQLMAKLHKKGPVYRLPSVAQAMGVPSIQRCVSLIANTVGSLPLQGYRNGVLMDPTPQVVARPDPFTTPRDFYRDMAYQMATRGETVLCIMSRDPDGTASALVVVPLAELNVEESPRNRLRPIYTWGNIVSTRYSPAHPEGRFVHITYLKEPGALRGVGPLQMAGAAASVSVEAQEWAARFYAQGGRPSTELHTGMDLDAAESEALLDQWTARESNGVQVTTGDMEIKEHGVNEQGAQMLQAREYNNGDAARLFGIPGMLLEYSSPGSSLTYQNITEVWTSFAKGCLIPYYLEPIEQAFSDLQPRSTHLEFYTQGLLRADIKTRYDVYKVGIESGVLTPENAQEMEGLIAGSPELAPVKPTPPSAVPSSIPFAIGTPTVRMAEQARCTYRRPKRRTGVTVLEECHALLGADGWCSKCKRSNGLSDIA